MKDEREGTVDRPPRRLTGEDTLRGILPERTRHESRVGSGPKGLTPGGFRSSGDVPRWFQDLGLSRDGPRDRVGPGESTPTFSSTVASP